MRFSGSSQSAVYLAAALAVASVTAFCGRAGAAVIYSTSDDANAAYSDATAPIDGDGKPDAGNTATAGSVVTPGGAKTAPTINVGLQNVANTLGRNIILPFVLPTLSPGQTFATANLTVSVTGYGAGAATAVPTVDLYGLTGYTGTLPTGKMYFAGTGDTTNTFGGAALQAAFLTDANTRAINSAPTLAAPAAVTSSDISAFLNSIYNNGAGAGTTVFLRLSATAALTTTNNNIALATWGNSGATTTSGVPANTANSTTVQPQITYTETTPSVPEPAALGAVLCGVLALGARRR
ncbi:MAG: hypothetical protein QM770_02030 [Tepidisphaeraceae bacterium]